MKKIWCLMLAVSLVFSMTACQQEEMVQKETEQETPAEIQENTPEETKPPQQKKRAVMDNRNRSSAGNQRNG